MRIRACVLIQTVVGKTGEVVQQIRAIEDVQSVDIITGPYDVIVVIESQDLRELNTMVSEKIRGIPYVTNTTTCIAIG